MFTKSEYTQKAIEANKEGKYVYILVNKETGDESLIVAPVGYYITEPNSSITYGEVNETYLIELIDKKKTFLSNKALIEAKKAIADGFVDFDGIKVETNSSTTADLNQAIITMEERDKVNYIWYDKDDNAKSLTKAELRSLIATIGEYKAEIWDKYYNYLYMIKKAKTADDLNTIIIDYNSESVQDVEIEEEDVIIND